MSTPFYDLASLVLVPSGYKAQKVYAQKPLTTDGQLTFSRASTATRVNSAGLIETVSSNVPRLDYLGSSCPKLQLEPQRTNLLTYSSAFDNAAWTKSSATVTANAAVSPDGTTTADLIATTFSADVFQGFYGGSAFSPYTCSFFVKPTTNNNVNIGFSDGVLEGFSYNFNLTTKSATLNTVPTFWSNPTYSIVEYQNGWYRCSVTATSTSNGNVFTVFKGAPSGSANYYVWGAQLEAGAYPTSYIPTTTAAVTRLADACSKTGISSLIGQTEGTLYVEFKFDYSDSNTQVLFKANQTSDANSVGIEVQGTTIKGLVNSGGGNIATITGTIATGTIKAALAYKTNDMAFYVNGTQVGVDTAGSIAFAGVVDILTIGQFLLNGTSYFPASRPFSQALVFKTRLTNAQLAELTSL